MTTVRTREFTINKAQARAIAEALEHAPKSAWFRLQQTAADVGGRHIEHLYLYDRPPSKAVIHISKSGKIRRMGRVN